MLLHEHNNYVHEEAINCSFQPFPLSDTIVSGFVYTSAHCHHAMPHASHLAHTLNEPRTDFNAEFL